MWCRQERLKEPCTMRECGDCQACCQGWLQGDAFGCSFGLGKPCVFLLGGCTVYEFRPKVCQNFFCAWAQEILPIPMRPDKFKVLVSVERWSGGQYLRCIGMGVEISEDAKTEIMRFCEANSAPVVFDFQGDVKIVGPDVFIEEFFSKSMKTGCSSQSGTSQAPSPAARLSLPLCHG